jgi:SAM-dependent methyltransferase
MDITDYNRKAWDSLVEKRDRWTVPVDAATIAEARRGNWGIKLTSVKSAPRDWFPENLHGKTVLCLASGGGQQGPVLAAAGADVTVFDNSAKQLAQDSLVAAREGLDIRTVQGDMGDLSCFGDDSFDLVVHPVSNVFTGNVLPVWREAARVLKTGGALLSGFCNPVNFIFDLEEYEQGKLTVRHRLPYSDTENLTEAQLENLLTGANRPVCFSHTLHDQIQGQIAAGLVITGLYEDSMGGEELLDAYYDVLIATRAVKITL